MGKGLTVGYQTIRSLDQNTNCALDKIRLDEVFLEVISRDNRDRPQLQRCIENCNEINILYVCSMDQFAWDSTNLLDLIKTFTENGVTVKFIKEGLSFDNSDNPVKKMMHQVMGAIAEFERSLQRERQKIGIKKAQEKGVKFGPKPAVGNEKLQQIIQMLQAGKNKSEIARELGIARQTLYKALKANKVEITTEIKAPKQIVQ